MTARDGSQSDLELKLLLEAIYLRYHCDFRSYSMASVKRRVTQALPRFGCETFTELQARVLYEPAVFAGLLDVLTVQVSDMFRDAEYYRVFREQIVPVLRTYPSLKLWVAGCSTGEEAYSFAIILEEEGLLGRSLIYATDIHPESLHAAAAGIYAWERVADFTGNHRRSGASRSLSECYTAAYGSVVLDRALAKRIVFSEHSLATDTVFAEVQLISCRNVLIYFDPTLQERAIELFRQALCHKGFLGLGEKESLRWPASAGSFTELPGGERWYQRSPR